jgi:hypothetical protein
MTGIAFCRAPSRGVESLKLGKRVQWISNRGWQDKARKVRAVGRDGEDREIPAIQQTLHHIRRTLRLSTTLYRRSTFDTP